MTPARGVTTNHEGRNEHSSLQNYEVDLVIERNLFLLVVSCILIPYFP